MTAESGHSWAYGIRWELRGSPLLSIFLFMLFEREELNSVLSCPVRFFPSTGGSVYGLLFSLSLACVCMYYAILNLAVSERAEVVAVLVLCLMMSSSRCEFGVGLGGRIGGTGEEGILIAPDVPVCSKSSFVDSYEYNYRQNVEI